MYSDEMTFDMLGKLKLDPLLFTLGRFHFVSGIKLYHGDILGLIERMAGRDRTAVADRQSRHQLIRLGWRMDAQHPVLAAAGSTQVEHRTEMGIGVVVTAHHLIPVAEHRPAALHVQS